MTLSNPVKNVFFVTFRTLKFLVYLVMNSEKYFCVPIACYNLRKLVIELSYMHTKLQ